MSSKFDRIFFLPATTLPHTHILALVYKYFELYAFFFKLTIVIKIIS